MVPSDHQWEHSAANTGESASLSRGYLYRYRDSSHQEHLKLVSVSLSLDRWSPKWGAWPPERVDGTFFTFISCKYDEEHLHIFSVRTVSVWPSIIATNSVSYSLGRAGNPLLEGKAGRAVSFYVLCSLGVPEYVGLRTWKKLLHTLTWAGEWPSMWIPIHSWCSQGSNTRDEMGIFFFFNKKAATSLAEQRLVIKSNLALALGSLKL